MFSKNTVKKLSLGAAGAVWLAIGSLQSANAASVKGGSTFTIASPPNLVYDGAGKVTTKKSSDDTVETVVTILAIGGGLAVIGLELSANNNKPTPVPTPALFPGLIALGLRLMHKRKSEQGRALKEA